MRKKNSLTANANKLFIVVILATILLGGGGSCDAPACECQWGETIYSCGPSSIFCETREAEEETYTLDITKMIIDVEPPGDYVSPPPQPKLNVKLGAEVGSPEKPGPGSVGFPIVPWTD